MKNVLKMLCVSLYICTMIFISIYAEENVTKWNSYIDDSKDQIQIQEGIDRYNVEY